MNTVDSNTARASRVRSNAVMRRSHHRHHLHHVHHFCPQAGTFGVALWAAPSLFLRLFPRASVVVASQVAPTRRGVPCALSF
ncbi:hypothetical protein [Gryllotalpicola koreensis]|uniref:hypothetical protein n=1 Tax=Gryllotalpicola koreensis TaxID=993086 RepID=UPI0031E0F79C